VYIVHVVALDKSNHRYKFYEDLLSGPHAVTSLSLPIATAVLFTVATPDSNFHSGERRTSARIAQPFIRLYNFEANRSDQSGSRCLRSASSCSDQLLTCCGWRMSVHRKLCITRVPDQVHDSYHTGYGAYGFCRPHIVWQSCVT
jgi:hypothetical protein